MPRRTVTRCLPRGDIKQLSKEEEWALIHGGGDIGPQTIDEYQTLWSAHGEAILKQWQVQLPGSRPWPMYYLNILPPLPAIHPTEKAQPYRLGARVWFSPWHYGKHGQAEIDHLLAVGAIDSKEAAAGMRRIKTHGPTTAPWNWISREN